MSKSDATGEFLRKLSESLDDGSFVRWVVSRPVSAGETPQKVSARCVDLKGTAHFSLTLEHATQSITKNMPVDAGVDWLRGQLGSAFRSAWLSTTKRDWQWFQPDPGTPRLTGHKPATTRLPPRAHDRSKQTILDDSARDWLRGLGIADATGRVRPGMADKHRQIHRYLEILTHLAKDCGWQTAPDPSAPAKALVIADMGCGKGYLTFGAWHLFRRVRRWPVRVLGIEAREELVRCTNEVARSISADGLEFVHGTIESADLPRVDALIALHACNTATDDAIRRGIEFGAKLIVVAPCCHQELRPQLGQPEPLAPVMRHGLMAERMAEWLTDGLRALYLEWAGYETKLCEFVSSEHTPKNLMLAAIRTAEPFTSEVARERIRRLKEFFGIEHHALDGLLARSADKPPKDVAG